jgi:hypothetical protein
MSVEKKTKKNSDFFSIQLFLGGASSGTAAVFTHPIGISRETHFERFNQSQKTITR